MFGCCIAGRLLQTNLQQIDETHAIFELPAASTINHICVFGTVPFPDGYGATVHFFWPGKGFQLLGMLSNDKPSAIFRLRGKFTSDAATTTTMQAALTGAMIPVSNPVADVTAVLGLAIEPLESIFPQIASLPANANMNARSDPAVLAERIVKHLLNYVSGFVDTQSGVDVLVPLNVVARWYESFMGKLRAGGVGFLDRGE